MSQEKLEKGVRVFFRQMEERLAGLTPAEKQQYLEGLFHAFDAVTRFCNPDDITPFEREQFISFAKTHAYSETTHLELDNSRMKSLVDTDSESFARSLAFAARVQMSFLGIPLDPRQQMKLEDAVSLAAIKADRKP
ncbi:MAG: hypothetical protein WC242_01665 [Candidatus Paceibacterota bacterium]|jgi:hypothetical protein